MWFPSSEGRDAGTSLPIQRPDSSTQNGALLESTSLCLQVATPKIVKLNLYKSAVLTPT